MASSQLEIDRIGDLCTGHNGKIHPDKACVLWCSLNNHAVKANMPQIMSGIEWLTQASQTTESCMSVDSVRKGEAWAPLQVDTERFTEVISTLGRQCREWAPGATHA